MKYAPDAKPGFQPDGTFVSTDGVVWDGESVREVMAHQADPFKKERK